MGIVAHVFQRYRPDAGSEVGRVKHRGVACDLSDFGGRSHAELPPTSGPPQISKRGESEAFLESRLQLRFDAGAEAEAHLVRLVASIVGMVEQHRHYHAKVVHDHGPSFADLGPPKRQQETLCGRCSFGWVCVSVGAIW
jgi:hypothetical protein